MRLTTLFRFLKPIPSRRPAARPRRPAARPCLEALEDRAVPAAGFGSAAGVGGPGQEWAKDIATDADGNVYVAGHFSYTVDFDPAVVHADGSDTLTASSGASTATDAFVAKYAADGSFLWARRMGGADGIDTATGLALGGLGGIYVTGHFFGSADFGTTTLTSAGSTDAFLARLNAADGSFLWASRLGGSYQDTANGVAADGDGNAYVAGSTNLTNTLVNANYDAYVAKFGPADGAPVWQKQFGGDGIDQANSVAADQSGNVYVTGDFRGTADFDPGAGTHKLSSGGRKSSPSRSAYVLKLDAGGDFGWASHFQASQWSASSGSGVKVDSAGDVVVAGSFTGTADFDPGKRRLNLDSVSGTSDVFVAKLNSSGNLNWAKQMGGGDDDGNYEVNLALDGADNIYLTGNFSGTADFDPGSGTYNLTSSGGEDVFVVTLDGAGAFRWAASAGGSGLDRGTGIAVYGQGDVYVTGFFQGTADFDPGAAYADGRDILTSAGNLDFFLWRLTQS